MIAEVFSDSDRARMNNKYRYPVRAVTETVANGFFTVDQKWSVKYWNKAAEKIMGVKTEDIIGKNLWEEFSDIIPVDFYSTYHKAFLEDVPVHFEEYWGEMEAWFDVIVYRHDRLLSVSFKSSSHLGQPEQEGQQLKTLNELYKFVTEITNDCLWEWDLKNRVIFWIDGGHKRVFGYQIENSLIPRQFWESRLHPDDRERVLSKINKTITGRLDTQWEDEYRFKRANGEYAYVCDRGHIVYDDEQVAIRIIGATQDITSRKLTEIKLAEERIARQNEITGAVLEAQETERSRIGRELHDNLNQILVATNMYIGLARKYEANRDIYLEKSSGYVLEVIEEIRKISKVLASPNRFIGLVDSIRNLLTDINNALPLKIIFQKEGIEDKELDLKVQVDIFRIVQEQINNILKHANATEACIFLARREKEIIMIVSDNGNGWDMATKKDGVGIQTL